MRVRVRACRSSAPPLSIIKKRHDYLVQCLAKARSGEELEEVPPKFDVVNTEIFKNIPVRFVMANGARQGGWALRRPCRARAARPLVGRLP